MYPDGILYCMHTEGEKCVHVYFAVTINEEII